MSFVGFFGQITKNLIFRAVIITSIIISSVVWHQQIESIPGLRSWFNGCEDLDLKDVYCDSKVHLGPYVIIERASLGFFNQFLKILSTIYLVHNFPGTIIFPGNSTARVNFTDFRQTIWGTIESSKFYDLAYFVRFWRERNVTICVESPSLNLHTEWIRKVSFCKAVVRSIPGADRKNLFSPPEYCSGVAKFNITPENFTPLIVSFFLLRKGRSVDANDAIVITPHWNSIPEEEHQILLDSKLRKVSDLGLSLRFSKELRCLGGKILSKFLRKSLSYQGATVGIHPRMEKDWKVMYSYVPPNNIVIQQFAEQLNKTRQTFSLAYIAAGNLGDEEQTLLTQWANKTFADRWVTKHSFSLDEEINKVPVEAQAAIDAVVLTELDYFVGQARSSFDAVICEYRTFLGRKTALINDFNNEFRPFLTTRKCEF